METIDVEGAIAFVGTNIPATRPKEWTVPEVPSECVQFAFSFHGVNINSTAVESMD
jgi:hypothetical protein